MSDTNLALTEIAPCTYLMPKRGHMRVDGLVITSPELMKNLELERPLQQVAQVAQLEGIVNYSIAMPDIHWGYGFPIGGVAAMDAKNGVISPGGVGYDINCGVRLATVPIKLKELSQTTQEALLKAIYINVPSGVGHGHRGQPLSERDYHDLLLKGARWSIEQGFGFSEDIEHIESHGQIEGALIECVSTHACERGKNQLGSIGSGNHFVEIGEIHDLIDPKTAELWGLFQGQLYILIHSGSRGFGHQVCQDTLDHFTTFELPAHLDPQLAAAPLNSEAARRYLAAMAAAANFAFNNRQQILHFVREAFQKVLGIDPKEIRLLYDVCHNIAKFEKHEVNGEQKMLCVHRKGATRAFGPHHPELSDLFQTTGQPVFIPGDMGRASYIMAGLGNPLTWCSAAHGAGRAFSRVQSKKRWRHENPIQAMKKQGILVMASSMATVSEEMPDAYKDVDLVAEATENARLAKRVARLKPKMALKG